MNMTQPKITSRNNKLYVNFSLDGKQYRKSLKLEDTKANRSIVKNQIIPQLILKIHSGEFFNNAKVPTVAEYIKVSFELHQGNRCSSTIKAHEQNYDKYIKNEFGHLVLDKITSKQITLWQNNLQVNHKLAKASIIKIRSVLNTMFEDALFNEIVVKNPVTKANKLRETENSKVKRVKLTPFSKMEISTILSSAKGQDQNLIALLFYTGVRAGECIGLKWTDINLKDKIIRIRRQIVQGIEKDVLKTTKSRRTIPIIDALVPYIESQYKITSKENSYVFLTKKTNKHYHGAGKIREQIWLKALNNAEVEYRNLHQTRGTFISTLISNGEDINYVSKIAGHENIKVTLERYSEYISAPVENFGKCFI